MPTIALQMYTLRDLAKDDFLGTFEKVAKLGYPAVELAGTGNLPAAELKRHLANLNLTPCATHTGYAELATRGTGSTIEYYRELGLKQLVCPFIPGNYRQSDADWQTIGRNLNDWGAQFRQAGFTFSYHNHDWEFRPLGGSGQLIWDALFQIAAPENLSAEIDTYWVARAGQDPVAYVRKYARRLPLLHIKDMSAGPEKRFAPIGTGTLDWKAIFAAAEAAGTQYYVVEQDQTYETPPLEAVRISLENLRKLGVK